MPSITWVTVPLGFREYDYIALREQLRRVLDGGIQGVIVPDGCDIKVVEIPDAFVCAYCGVENESGKNCGHCGGPRFTIKREA